MSDDDFLVARRGSPGVTGNGLEQKHCFFRVSPCQGPGHYCGCQPGGFLCAGFVAGTGLLTRLGIGGGREELLSGHSWQLGSRKFVYLVTPTLIPPGFGLCLERALNRGKS